MTRLAPLLLLLPLAACDLNSLLQAVLASGGGPYGEGPLEAERASLIGRIAGDDFSAEGLAPTGSWNETGARVELRAPGRAGFGMVFLELFGGGLDDPSFAPGNEYTLTDGAEVRQGGPTVSLVGCWAQQEGEGYSYDAHAQEFHLAVEPGERPDEVLFRVTTALLHEEKSEPLELTLLARRAMTQEQLDAQREEPAPASP